MTASVFGGLPVDRHDTNATIRLTFFAEPSLREPDLMLIDRHALDSALNQLQRRSFPGHPEDVELAGWILELAEIDGHIAGLAATVLGATRAEAVHLDDVASHAHRLTEIRVVGEDERVYDDCVAYLEVLRQVEQALNGHRGTAR